MSAEKYRPSFYLTVNSLFILLILVVGGILSWHSYRSTKRIVLASADRIYDQVVREVSQGFGQTYQPVFHTVRLLSMTPVMDASTLEERLRELDLLGAVLERQAELSAIQVGYDNGDYFIVRPLRSDRTRALFEAPAEAAFVVDHVARQPSTGERGLLRMFFDKDFRQALRREPQATVYDPRTRPWFVQASSTEEVTAVAPYLFFFLREVGTTVGYRPPGSAAVIAADITLRQISDTLRAYRVTPRSEIALIGAEGRILAYSNPDAVIVGLEGEKVEIARLPDLESGVLAFLQARGRLEPGPLEFDYQGEAWRGAVRTLNVSGIEGRDLTLVMVSPGRELLAGAIRMVRRSLLVTLAILLLSIPAASLAATFVSGALKRLSGEAALISRFDFSRPVSVRSSIREVDELAQSMGLMKTTISQFLYLVRSLAEEQDFDAMLESITEETLKVSAADGVLTYAHNEATDAFEPGALYDREGGRRDVSSLPSPHVSSEGDLAGIAREKAQRTIFLSGGGRSDLAPLLPLMGEDHLAVIVMPLQNRESEVIGLLGLIHRVTRQQWEERPRDERRDFVRTFSGFAAVSLESRRLLKMQKLLMESFLQVLAGAIDAKSPYTGGHCQRVPVITRMLAQAACDSDDPRYRDFSLDEKEWEAVHIASWLHDCGKVTTPEYVVDKATKLETIYDRIHEIRTRFEVLKRDAEIRFWEQVDAGGDKAALREALEEERRQLDEDFAFVAECNLGGEFMAPERVTRLEKIAERTWQRTIDDRLGISWEEMRRKEREPARPLPVEERVIQDRPDHFIERTRRERMPPDNRWGFRLDVPEHRYNRGELYNLKVGRGTLDDEERFKINDHIVQTIIMLNKLPYPGHLKDVPEIAGGHHETMDGKGYPRRLTGDQMSLTARMMAIADIFEALTASDRPYKKAKPLSVSIRIMSRMRDEGHIDSDLFELFLRSGVHLRYAKQYLHSSQVDDVDIEQHLGPGKGQASHGPAEGGRAGSSQH